MSDYIVNRWHVVIIYKDSSMSSFFVEELEELHDIIEHGPVEFSEIHSITVHYMLGV